MPPFGGPDGRVLERVIGTPSTPRCIGGHDGLVDAAEVVRRFGLDDLSAEPSVAASGWGGRNRVWRFDTKAATFAVKEAIPELVPAGIEDAFRIERRSHEAGIASAEPVPSLRGRCFEQIDGRWYRCHRWVDGAAKENEGVNEGEAAAMGALVASLHRLEIPVSGPAPKHAFGAEHWQRLAQSAGRCRWAPLVRGNLDAIVEAETVGASAVDETPVGSHRDLNAHNVLFTVNGLVLIDWDGAGPISPQYERASTAVLWAQRRDGGLEVDRLTAFLRSYRSGGGTLTGGDCEALVGWLSGLVWWTERNVQIALADPSEHHDELATQLVSALLDGPATVRMRQDVLATAIAQL